MDIAIEPGSFDGLRRPGWEWDDHPDVVVGRIDGEPAAALRLFPRILESSTVRMSMLGIGGVFTKVGFRSRGLATEILRWTIHSSLGNFACVGLFSSRGIEDNVYLSVGFIQVKQFFQGKLHCYSLSSDVDLLESQDWQLNPPGHF